MPHDRAATAKRKANTFKIDGRVLDGIARAAKLNNTSQNHYIETIIIKHCQSLGLLDTQFEPLGEQCGGDRSGEGCTEAT